IVPSPGGSRQRAWHVLAPFLDPAARPVLTYQIDADTTPRTLTVRAAGFAAPFGHRTVSEFQLGFKAADPLAKDAAGQVAFVWAARAGARNYNLIFNRTYPVGGGSLGVITTSAGDFAAYPLLQIYGPATGPALYAQNAAAALFRQLVFAPAFVINAGDYVQVDCYARSAFYNNNPAQSVYGQIVAPQAGWANWPVLPAGVAVSWSITAAGPSNQTGAQINWNDVYLL
ncbi:MAG TPA: hypothetical protein VGP90_03615, partial [Acidimicrobiia bacterium]|nr:hypothetical protein [Acidimicrobiia bacterium]